MHIRWAEKEDLKIKFPFQSIFYLLYLTVSSRKCFPVYSTNGHKALPF